MKGFQLDKWFLDFIDEDGSAMIFYAARMRWHGFAIPYGSWIRHRPDSGTTVLSKFRKVHFPKKENGTLCWSDPSWGVEGKWHVRRKGVSALLHESNEGLLDWQCLQPASSAELSIDGKFRKAIGYAEHLTLTIPPWKIPMDELRWGHFCGENTEAVWVDILFEGNSHSWLWLNGKRIHDVMIGDDSIEIGTDGRIELDKAVTLESEAKIQSVAKDISNYIPGFSKILPTKFLLAEEKKWLSKAIYKGQGIEENGWSIHELVKFG